MKMKFKERVFVSTKFGNNQIESEMSDIEYILQMKEFIKCMKSLESTCKIVRFLPLPILTTSFP